VVPDATGLKLDPYLERIGYTGERRASLAGLDAIHLAHATSIPFENLDVLLGRPIHLDLHSLQQKLVAERRGGYCFEQNLLFAAGLVALGYLVTPLAARVMLNVERVLPRTHMALLVEVDGQQLLADVGFGAEGLLLPVPFVVSQPVKLLGRSYVIDQEVGRYVLRRLGGDAALSLYSFTLEPQLLVDYEVASYFVSTHPDSIFTQLLIAQRLSADVRYTLRNQDLTVNELGTVTTRTLADDDELLAVLASTFGLPFPAGTRFNYRRPAV